MNDLQHRRTPFRERHAAHRSVLGVAGGRAVHPQHLPIQGDVHVRVIRADLQSPRPRGLLGVCLQAQLPAAVPAELIDLVEARLHALTHESRFPGVIRQ